MSIYESAVRDVPAIPVSDPAVFKQLLEAAREMPGIINGVLKLAKPFYRKLAVLAAFNIAIATWAALQPFILKFGVDTIAPNVPYLTIVSVIVFPVLVIGIPHGILLPFGRDFYTMWCLTVQFKHHVSRTCRQYQRSGLYKGALKGKGPAIQEGREAAWGVLLFITREPFFAAKGVAIAVILGFLNPLLTALVAVGLVADIYITLRMRKRTILPIAQMSNDEQELKGFDNLTFDVDLDAVSDDEYDAQWHKFLGSTRRAEKPKMLYQVFWRGGTSQIIRIVICLLVGWWVCIGRISIGEYYLLVSLAASATDPFEIFLGFMWDLVKIRQILYRLGIAGGFDFRLLPPEQLT